MIDNNHTIVLKNNSEYFKLIKLIYGRDGSIYISSPYHKSTDAIVFLATINYSKNEMWIKLDETIEKASVNDGENSLKLSHHRSGLIQVSGKGITSGVDENGNLKGIGIQSFPLETPVPGPMFGVTIYGYNEFKKSEHPKNDFRVFEIDDLIHNNKMNCLTIEGYCFSEKFKRFIRTDSNGNKMINLLHPSGTTIPLKVLLPKESVECQSFIGIDLYFNEGMENPKFSSYKISSATGNLRLNSKNEELGDAVFVMYPRQSLSTMKNLNYEKD